jgi:hypothetical protein
MPPKIKQGPTAPPPVLPPAPSPADAGNAQNPTAAATTPAPGSLQQDVGLGTSNSGSYYFSMVVNGKPVNIVLNQLVQATDPVNPNITTAGEVQRQFLHPNDAPVSNTVMDQIKTIQSWYSQANVRQKYINEMYQAGLISSKKSPSANEVASAWAMVVQEAAIQNKTAGVSATTPDDLLAKASQQGWSALNPTISTQDGAVNGTGNLNNAVETSSQSETIYKSYVDPATAMGALADAYYRLMGRNPNAGEYQAFLKGVYGYQEQVNTGSDKTVTKGPNTGNIDPQTGLPVDQSGTTTSGAPPLAGTSTQTNVVSQRGIGQRGLEFLAGQAAMANPEEAQYQAATTVFSSIIQALGAPGAAGTSGPTVTAP